MEYFGKFILSICFCGMYMHNIYLMENSLDYYTNKRENIILTRLNGAYKIDCDRFCRINSIEIVKILMHLSDFICVLGSAFGQRERERERNRKSKRDRKIQTPGLYRIKHNCMIQIEKQLNEPLLNLNVTCALNSWLKWSCVCNGY